MNNRQAVCDGERGSALVVSLIMVVLLSGLIVFYLTVSASNLRLTESSYECIQALYVAETGIAKASHEIRANNMAVFVLNDEGKRVFTGTYTTWSDIGQVEVGEFSVEYVELEAGSKAALVSTGFFREVRRTVEVHIRRKGSFDLSYAILAEQGFGLGGNFQVYGDVHSNDAIDVNGSPDIHAAEERISETVGNGRNRVAVEVNQDLTPPDSRLNAFQGSLTAVGEITSTHNGLDGVNGAVEDHASRVPIPQIDPDAIIAAAEAEGRPVTVYEGDMEFNNSTSPIPDGIVYVKGDIRITGNVDGDALVIADGDIFVAGNTQLGLGSAGDPASLMFWAGDDIHLQGATDVYGILFANDDVTIRGGNSLNVFGSVICGGRDTNPGEAAQGAKFGSDFHGSVTIHYVRPDDDLTGLATEWAPISWREVGG
ncbi:MAG: hypothetical protein AB1696_12810 [Planctomycetota bacterium]